jgi:CRP-like cAMP-binding protein
LGKADDVIDADGVLALNHAQAQERARAWFAREARSANGQSTQSTTYSVKDAIADYLSELQRRDSKSLEDTASRARAHILPQLGNVSVDKLSAIGIRDWHQQLSIAARRVRSKRRGAPQYWKLRARNRGKTPGSVMVAWPTA